MCRRARFLKIKLALYSFFGMFGVLSQGGQMGGSSEKTFTMTHTLEI